VSGPKPVPREEPNLESPLNLVFIELVDQHPQKVQSDLASGIGDFLLPGMIFKTGEVIFELRLLNNLSQRLGLHSQHLPPIEVLAVDPSLSLDIEHLRDPLDLLESLLDVHLLILGVGTFLEGPHH